MWKRGVVLRRRAPLGGSRPTEAMIGEIAGEAMSHPTEAMIGEVVVRAMRGVAGGKEPFQVFGADIGGFEAAREEPLDHNLG